MCCDSCCPRQQNMLPDVGDLSLATADSFVQVWDELDALRQEREAIRGVIFADLDSLARRIQALENRRIGTHTRCECGGPPELPHASWCDGD